MSLDQELQAAFAVEPSPEFVAAVRTRIAREEAPAGPGFRTAWFAAASVAAVVVAAAAVGRMDRNQDAQAAVSPMQQAAAEQTSVAPAARVAPLVGVRPAELARVGANRRADAPPSRVTQAPEVMASPGAAEGLAALFVAMDEGRVDLAVDATDSVSASIGAFMPVEPSVREIPVPPMTVQVVAAITDSEGARW